MEKQKVEFVSYDGEYPNLCSETLVLRIDGEIVRLNHCLCSGGGFDEDWNRYEGEWSVNLPKELKHLETIITDIVNTNIEHGCCGGCE